MATSWVIVAAGMHFRGGMDKANAELASYLLNHGAAVHMVAHEVDRSLAEHPLATVHVVPRPLGSFALGEFGLGSRGRAVARAVCRAEPRTRVVVNGGNCRWPDINWVHYVHHAWTDIDAAAPAWFKAKHHLFSLRWRRCEKAALRSARIVIANSALTREHLVTRVGIPAGRIRTVYLGADAGDDPASPAERAAARQWLRIDDRRPAIAFVGALGLDRRKGFDTLWRAWLALCATASWDAILVVAGAGAEAGPIEADAARAGILDRIRLLGHTTRIREVLAAADLLVSPVRYEPYGLNVQEALCRGVPAIVSRRAGVAERYPQVLEGLLLNDPDSSDELVGRLKEWRASIEEWKARAAPFGRELRAHGWPDMARVFVETVGSAS